MCKEGSKLPFRVLGSLKRFCSPALRIYNFHLITAHNILNDTPKTLLSKASLKLTKMSVSRPQKMMGKKPTIPVKEGETGKCIGVSTRMGG